MKLSEYQVFVKTTAIYPDQHKISYPILGLVGEVGELYELGIKSVPREIVLKEIGDCYWYIGSICNDTGMYMDQLEHIGNGKTLLQNVTLLANEGKKLVRDGMTVGQLAKVNERLENIICELRDELIEAHITVSECLQANVDKLTSRKERGVLGGSGDNR